MTDQPDVVSVERLIPAPPGDIFAILCDPSRHHEIDGSGTLRDARGEPQILELGSTFGMSMKMGIPYSMANTVVEFETDRRIAWQTRGPGAIGKHFGGRIWRYELETVDDGTLVRESWDVSQESTVTKPFVRRLADSTRRNMAASLQRIDDVLAPKSG